MTRPLYRPHESLALDLPPTVAIYTRYSNDDFQDSTESQVQSCMSYARQKGWLVREDLILSDEGLSGQTLATRDKLVSLLSVVETGKATFAGILVDDTSRLGRNVSDVLSICNEILDNTRESTPTSRFTRSAQYSVRLNL